MVCKHVFSASAINADHVIPGHGLLRAVLVPNDWFYLHVQAVPQRLPQYSLCCASIALSKKLPNLWRGIPYALELLPQRFQMGQAAGAFSFPPGSHVGASASARWAHQNGKRCQELKWLSLSLLLSLLLLPLPMVLLLLLLLLSRY